MFTQKDNARAIMKKFSKNIYALLSSLFIRVSSLSLMRVKNNVSVVRKLFQVRRAFLLDRGTGE